MNITINFHGDIHTHIYGCPDFPFDNLEDEDFDETENRKVTCEVDDSPDVILCGIEGLPENTPPEVAEAIAKAVIAALTSDHGNPGNGHSHE